MMDPKLYNVKYYCLVTVYCEISKLAKICRPGDFILMSIISSLLKG